MKLGRGGGAPNYLLMSSFFLLSESPVQLITCSATKSTARILSTFLFPPSSRRLPDATPPTTVTAYKGLTTVLLSLATCVPSINPQNLTVRTLQAAMLPVTSLTIFWFTPAPELGATPTIVLKWIKKSPEDVAAAWKAVSAVA